MFDDYCDRFRKSGRALGFRSLSIEDVDAGGTLETEGQRLITKIPPKARVMRLDEGGEQMTSKQFAAFLAKLRDDGQDELVFLIGGAAGFGENVRQAAPHQMAFGSQTWPHRLVRVMLAEQIYRAASLLAGSPYHKA